MRFGFVDASAAACGRSKGARRGVASAQVPAVKGSCPSPSAFAPTRSRSHAAPRSLCPHPPRVQPLAAAVPLLLAFTSPLPSPSCLLRLPATAPLLLAFTSPLPSPSCLLRLPAAAPLLLASPPTLTRCLVTFTCDHDRGGGPEQDTQDTQTDTRRGGGGGWQGTIIWWGRAGEGAEPR